MHIATPACAQSGARCRLRSTSFSHALRASTMLILGAALGSLPACSTSPPERVGANPTDAANPKVHETANNAAVPTDPWDEGNALARASIRTGATRERESAPLFEEIPAVFSTEDGFSVGESDGGPARMASTGLEVIRHTAPLEKEPPAAEAALESSVLPAATMPARETPDGDLAARGEQIMTELRSFLGRERSALTHAERLRKYKLETQLMALHFLLPAEDQDRAIDALIASLDVQAEPPAKAHLLMSAAFFQDIGLDEMRDRCLDRLSLAPSPERVFGIENLTLCTEVRRYGDYSPFPRRSLRGGEDVVLYAELLHLKSVPEGDGYVTGIEAAVTVYDDTDRAVYRAPLSRAGGERLRRATPAGNDYFRYGFRVPSVLDEGKYRLVVEVEDLHANRSAQAEAAIKVRK